jgi:hypothetical protein
MGKIRRGQPFIWLQGDELQGKADKCDCVLTFKGDDPAFYLCPMHEAAHDLYAACLAAHEWFQNETTGLFPNLSLLKRLQGLILQLKDAIDRAEGKKPFEEEEPEIKDGGYLCAECQKPLPSWQAEGSLCPECELKQGREA